MTTHPKRNQGALSLWAIASLVVPIVSFTAPARSGETIKITPVETDAILANPGMGWQTFHRTRKQDRNLPEWIPSTVHYARWGWGELEPAPGKLNTGFLDRVLDESRQSGQKLAMRVMCCSSSPRHPYHPAWLKDIGGRELECDYEGQSLRIPDLDDPEVLSRHLDFIHRLGRRYDGHPDLDHVDLGSVGWWGEWHLSGSRCRINRLETRTKVVEAYLAAFRQTPLLMLIGGRECLALATQRGAGWRADCLGDMGGFSRNWNHMRGGYPVWIAEFKIQNVWQNAPVAWESCWDMRKWVREGWPLRSVFNYALALHGSYLNNKSAPLPEGDHVRPEIERFLRRLGYRLVLKELIHPAVSAAGQQLSLTMRWQNQGSAPCYRPYRVAYRLSGEQGQWVVVGQTRVNRWMPGSVELFTPAFFAKPPDLPRGPLVDVKDSVQLPAAIPAGQYQLSLAVVAERDDKPVVRLGIQGVDVDGWYPMGRIKIQRPADK